MENEKRIFKIGLSTKQLNGFAYSMKRLREYDEISLNDMQKSINISKQNLSRYERNEMEPSITKAYLIAQYFDVTLEEMINKEWTEEDLKQRIERMIEEYEEEHNI